MSEAPRIEDLVGRTEALADGTRLRLLRLLERHELGVSDLVEVLQLPQSSVSRHLKLLVDRGWISGRSQGAANLYAMRPAELPTGARRLWQILREQGDGWATSRQDELRLARRLAERRDVAQAFFARSAKDWDRLRRELYGCVFGDAALRGLLPRHWTVADLACGTGAVAAGLAPHVARVIAVDHSPAMLRSARRRLEHVANVDLRHAELEALPIEDGTCDAALLLLALAYVVEPSVVLSEVRRILKPGGRVVVVDLLRHDRDDFRVRAGQQRNGFEPEELTALLAGSELVPDHCAPLDPEAEAKGPALLLAAAASHAAPAAHSMDLKGASPRRRATERKKA